MRVRLVVRDGNQSPVEGRDASSNDTRSARLGWGHETGITVGRSQRSVRAASEEPPMQMDPRQLLRLPPLGHLTQSTHHPSPTGLLSRLPSLGSFAPLPSLAAIYDLLPSIDRRRGSRSTSLCPCSRQSLSVAVDLARSSGPSCLDHSSKQTSHLSPPGDWPPAA